MVAEQVRRRNVAFLGVTVLLSLIIVILGFLSADGRTQFFYVLAGLPILVAALIGIARVRMAADDRTLGARSIQHNWITLSVALALLSLVPAEFFLTSMLVRAAAGVLAGILVLASAYLLLNTKKATGVDLSI